MTKHRQDIDGLRALAVLPVLLFHAELGCPGGFVGVDIFFVISGFLIASLILTELDEGKFSLVTFWERRIRRILPALTVVVLATLAAGWFLFLPEDFVLIGRSAIAQAALMSNVFFYFHTNYFNDATETVPLLHTWSLAVEEQFYLLFPLLLIVLARRKKLSIPRTIAMLALGSFALSVLATHRKPAAAFYLLPTRAWELMTGAFLAAVPGWRWPARWMREGVAFGGLGLILFSIFFYTAATRFPGAAALLPCLGAAFIILSGGQEGTLVGTALRWQPVVFIGLISYPLYLWHWPLLVFARYDRAEPLLWMQRAAVLGAAAVLATLSWRYVETPFRQRLICSQRPRLFALAGCSMAGLMLLGGAVCWSHGIPARVPALAAVYSQGRYDFAFRNEITLDEAAAGAFAELGGQSTNQPIDLLLWGDSHAMAVAPVLDDLCRQFSVRGVQATHSTTAPLLGYVSRSGYSLQDKSAAFSKSVLDFIVKNRIRTVVLAARWTSYGPPDSLDADFISTIRAITASGARAYVLKDVPAPGFDVPRYAALTVLHHGDLRKLAIPPCTYRTSNEGFDRVFDQLSAMGADVLDAPQYFLNSNGFYDVVRDGKTLYWDWHHLSVAGAHVLKPMFEPLFRQLKQGTAKN